MTLFVFDLLTAALAAEVGPIQKVIQLLDELQAKVISEGEGSQVQYEEFVDWCGKQAGETQRSIADSGEQIDTLDAAIETAKANIDELTAEIDGLTSGISRGEAELAAAKDQRATEHEDFLSRDEHLGETVDMLTRASAVLEKNLAAVKTEAVQGALLKLTSTLATAVDAAFIALPDKQLVQSLLQKVDQQDGKDDLDVSLLDVSQPQAAQVAYEGSGGAIIQTLADLREKAESTRAASQKAEMEAAHAYNMFEQASETELKAQGEQLETAKKRLNKNDEAKAAAEGEIETVKGAKASSEKYLKDTQQECMERASEWEAESAERSEELKTLAAAKKILSQQGVDQAEGRLAEIQAPLAFLQLSAKAALKAKVALPERQVEAASYLRKE